LAQPVSEVAAPQKRAVQTPRGELAEVTPPSEWASPFPDRSREPEPTGVGGSGGEAFVNPFSEDNPEGTLPLPPEPEPTDN
jgi:hypothetical protein